MKISINFSYDTIDNLVSILWEPNINKKEFIDSVYYDLWDNYLYNFFPEYDFKDYNNFESWKIEKIKSVISNEQIESLWNLYIWNKDIIDAKIKEKLKQIEQNYEEN